MIRFILTVVFLTIGLNHINAQSPKCGVSALHAALTARGYEIKHDSIPHSNTAYKTTNTEVHTIPVVFHIVLNLSQITQLGGDAGLQRYIDSQMAVINRDFNAQNADTATIPAAFKHLKGDARINFALARTAPDGSSSNGVELLATSKSGFELSGFTGSGLGFSEAKYKQSGGLNAWDPSTYMNVWIINPLDKGSPTNILGITFPPSLVKEYNIPEVELGIIVSYKAWGSINNFNGRTLTHEMGHYFELRHLWGDDDGKCPSNGGEDDGIADTPPQSKETYGCPVFPKFDNCTNSGSGIMFMNYMDYTNDDCQRMFTMGQVSYMRTQLEIFGSSFGLTQHPEVLNYPVQAADNSFVIYPNPSRGKINIGFTRTTKGLEYIYIIDAFGRSIQRTNITEQKGFYTLEFANVSSGLYFIQLKFADKTLTEKIVLTHD